MVFDFVFDMKECHSEQKLNLRRIPIIHCGACTYDNSEQKLNEIEFAKNPFDS